MMEKDIRNILKTYNTILGNKKVVLGEADISGIDELVYNPATKKSGTIGHGYDGGKKVQGITWSNHDDHLHIGFTNRDVAMAVIDKADQMGLKTTENPYAKKDPNGKVDKVHTSGSFHYKVFPGEPKVGAGVDISGNPQTITELIKWIETNYASGSYPEQQTVDYTDTDTKSPTNPTEVPATTPSSSTSYTNKEYNSGDPFVSHAIGQVFNKILGMKESIHEASLFGGKSFKWGGGPSDHGSRSLGNWQSDNAWDIMAAEGVPVYSISDGTISKIGGSDKLSKNGVVYGYQVTVNTDNNSIFYTHFGKLGPNISQGASIKKGDLIGYIGKPKENDKWPTHVHIGIKKGNIKQFINTNADIIGAENITTDNSTDTFSTTTSGTKLPSEPFTKKSSDIGGGDPFVSHALGQVFNKIFGLNESSSGKEKRYITFCNISNPKTFRNGQNISKGEVIGNTSTDVNVSKYDDSYNKVSLTPKDFNLGKNISYNFGEATIPNSDNPKIKSPIDGIINNSRFIRGCTNQITVQFEEEKFDRNNRGKVDFTTTSYADPLLGDIISAPFKLFQDKYDEDGTLKQKRWGYPGQKVDPWIVDTLSSPFKKIGKIFKEEEQRKIQENIERIKKLIK